MPIPPARASNQSAPYPRYNELALSTNPKNLGFSLFPTLNSRASAHTTKLLRIRLIRILTDKDLADERLEIRSRHRQVDRACRLLRAEGQSVGDGAIDDVDARLVDRVARLVADEIVLGGDDHGRLSGL